MKKLILTAAVATALTLTMTMCSKTERQNPFLSAYTTEYEIPPFDQIEYADYLPAMQAGFDEWNANIQRIVDNPDSATFENTIVAFMDASPILERVSMVLGALSESDSNEDIDRIWGEFLPAYTAQSDEVLMNEALFARVKAVHDNIDALDTDQQRLTDKYYKMFVRAGAALAPQEKEALKAVNAQISDLYLKFNKNLLDATNAFQIVVDDPARLAGLPEASVAQAADEAKARGLEGKWVFTLHAPSRLPLLQYADDRDLRREMYQGYTSLASTDSTSNYPVINQLLQARATKAKLLGFDNFGAYQTDAVMANTVDAAEGLLMQIWGPAVKRVNQEVAEMQAIVDAEGGDFKIAPWDYYYYAEKVRKQKYDLDENEVRQYFVLDSVRNGMFQAAERLYGIRFTEMPDAPKYHPDVTVYDVTDAETGDHVAVFMTDYFPRPEKRQGAWMSDFKGSWQNADGTWSRPVVYNVGNLTRPTATTPSLLTIDEVETMFHEFGHGLHSMLSYVRYKDIAGTNCDRDFVELPSQINEHWAFTPELLSVYAKHYKTGEPIPAELVEKLVASGNHGQGFATAELAGAALLDLEYSKLNPTEDIDIPEFEQQVAEKLGMPAELTFRYRSPYFKHIFGSGEYAAGYYTYLWAEVLDQDGFQLFEERGVFDPETAKSFKDNVLSKGGSDDPMVLYERFRGQAPDVKALLKGRGLE